MFGRRGATLDLVDRGDSLVQVDVRGEPRRLVGWLAGRFRMASPGQFCWILVRRSIAFEFAYRGIFFCSMVCGANVGDVWVVSGIDCDGQFPDSVSGHGTALEFIYS